MIKEVSIRSSRKEEIIDITHVVDEHIKREGIEDGYIVLHVPHTTAGITINENADPDVKDDILLGLKRFDDQPYAHMEGNSPAHIKTSLMGNNTTIIIEKGKPMLGTWQGIMFCEFDGPRERKLWISNIFK
jgi:secondary thiamine-phosphate synthase enzyme